jgi:ribosomal protein S4
MLNNNSKKTRFKPLYKQLLKLRVNALYNFKILKLKKKKWENFLYYFKTQFNKTKYKKYRIIDQSKLLINRKNKFELNYNKSFKKKFIFFKVFNIFFGKLKKTYYKILKNKIKNTLKTQKIKNIKLFMIKKLESRLDYVLYKSKFCLTIRSARQYIAHGHINVNKSSIKNPSFILKSGDLISLNPVLLKKYKKNLTCSPNWPLYPNYLIINYKTMEILFFGSSINETNSIFMYPFYFKY